MTLDASKALIRRLFEEVLPAGDPASSRALLAPELIDHDPSPERPAAPDGIVILRFADGRIAERRAGFGRPGQDAA